MERELTPEEKATVKQLIDAGELLPHHFLPLLFPKGDGTVGERELKFQGDIKRLNAESWTAFAQPTAPSEEIQAAWPWRREIYYVHFCCADMIKKAYRTYSSGWYSDSEGFNNISRILLRSGQLVGALTLHNSLEDRIAQLFNALLASPCNETKVKFRTTFENQTPSITLLAGTRKKAGAILGDTNFRKIHELANEVKHKWTGEMLPHVPKPQRVRDDLKSNQASYVQSGLPTPTCSFLPQGCQPSSTPPIWDMKGRISEQAQRAMANIDAICESMRQSHNMLVDLALCLDAEVDWPRHGLRWEAPT